jgi:hypothetical protein
VPFNDTTQAIDFETPLFKGKVLVMMRGMADTPAVFDGKKRLMWMAIQVGFGKATAEQRKDTVFATYGTPVTAVYEQRTARAAWQP